ncbi:hypothetical protein AGR5A_Lc80078 [Agrobacterium genomosp. 5 str. CFBP 6626]|nr:hypothetical protein AGR5A_Lc80078 [Agrobacterium genomosp. 5 str. CFBP 6626]
MTDSRDSRRLLAQPLSERSLLFLLDGDNHISATEGLAFHLRGDREPVAIFVDGIDECLMAVGKGIVGVENAKDIIREPQESSRVKRIFHDNGVDPQPTLNISNLPAYFRIIELVQVIVETMIVTEKPVNLSDAAKRCETKLETKILDKPCFNAARLPRDKMQVTRAEFGFMSRRIEIGYYRRINVDKMHVVPKAADSPRQLEYPATVTLIGRNGRDS